MNRKLLHILIPAIFILLFSIVAALPVSLLGCVTRGLIALILAFGSGILSLAAALLAVKKTRNNPDSAWWVISAVMLMIPVVGLLILG